MAKLRELTLDEVEVTLRTEWEDMSVRNHFDTDEPERDRALEAEILARMDRGDVWAWCTVVVTAKWGGFFGDDSLGACSYVDEAEFRKGGYWEDLQAEALSRMNAQIAEVYAQVEPLIEYRDPEVPA